MMNKFRRIFDVAATSQIGRKWQIISSNLQRRYDVAYWSKMTNNLRRICELAATSQIGRKLFVIFVESATLQPRRRFVEIFSSYSTNMRRRSDVADSSKLFVIFDQSTTSQRRRRFVEIYSSCLTNLRRRGNLFVIFDLSATLLRRRSFVKIYSLFSTNLRRRSDDADSSKLVGHEWRIYDVVATSWRGRESCRMSKSASH